MAYGAVQYRRRPPGADFKKPLLQSDFHSKVDIFSHVHSVKKNLPSAGKKKQSQEPTQWSLINMDQNNMGGGKGPGISLVNTLELHFTKNVFCEICHYVTIDIICFTVHFILD